MACEICQTFRERCHDEKYDSLCNLGAPVYEESEAFSHNGGRVPDINSCKCGKPYFYPCEYYAMHYYRYDNGKARYERLGERLGPRDTLHIRGVRKQRSPLRLRVPEPFVGAVVEDRAVGDTPKNWV